MKITVQDDQMIIQQIGPWYREIVSWGKFRYVKKDQTLRGPVDLDCLNQLSRMTDLSPEVERIRKRLQRRRVALEAERNRKDVHALVDYPVKHPLFQHQIRGANMALIAFGIVPDGREVTG